MLSSKKLTAFETESKRNRKIGNQAWYNTVHFVLNRLFCAMQYFWAQGQTNNS